MLDILPKLGLLERQGVALDSIDHFLVRQITGDFQRETLQRLGIDESRIVETIDRQYLQCEKLLHVDMNNGINLKMNRFIPLWLKHKFLSSAEVELPSVPGLQIDAGVAGTDRLRLYIGRPEGVRRGILNEDAIKPIVEAAGFRMVVMEGLRVAEQVALLSRADALMAPHGGALTNMVFCRPGIPVIELMSRHVYPYYYGLAELCGHRYHAIMQDPEKDYGRLVNHRIAQAFADPELQWRTQNESFTVDTAAVEAMMARLPSRS
jgi:capsular polysaccharide biosynthesis protein